MIQRDQPRQEIRSRLEAARAYVSAFTGLYSDEDLAQEVLAACDEVMIIAGSSARLHELRRVVEARCRRLTEVTNRFSARDPVVMAAARVQIIVAIDQIQDAALERLEAAVPQNMHSLLRRRSL